MAISTHTSEERHFMNFVSDVLSCFTISYGFYVSQLDMPILIM